RTLARQDRTVTDAGETRRVVVGISGASGVIYGIRLLEALRDCGIETHLVMSRSAEITLAHETDYKVAQVRALADRWYQQADIGAAIASGSFRTMGMVVAPCSVRSMSEIATGVTSGLLTRAADVVLKDGRRPVLMVRDTPCHLCHARTMAQLAQMGAINAPPLPACYPRPKELEGLSAHSNGGVLCLLRTNSDLAHRWKE